MKTVFVEFRVMPIRVTSRSPAPRSPCRCYLSRSSVFSWLTNRGFWSPFTLCRDFPPPRKGLLLPSAENCSPLWLISLPRPLHRNHRETKISAEPAWPLRAPVLVPWPVGSSYEKLAPAAEVVLKWRKKNFISLITLRESKTWVKF